MSKPDFNAQADELIALLDIPRRVHGTLSSALRDAYAAGLENAALLWDSIDNGCSCEPEGCGAMGAIIQYREAIRGLKE